MIDSDMRVLFAALIGGITGWALVTVAVVGSVAGYDRVRGWLAVRRLRRTR